jgi:hypothetical protein
MGLFCLLFSSCAYSKHPLSSPEEARIDERLLGVWKPRDPDAIGSAYAFCFVGKCSEQSAASGTMKSVIVDCNRSGVVQVETWEFFATKLGSHSYLSASTKPLGGPLTADQRYVLFKYILAGDSLTLRFMDPMGAQSAVKDGKLHGALPSGGFDPVSLLSSSEELKAFLLGGGDSVLFPPGNEIVWDRVKR